MRVIKLTPETDQPGSYIPEFSSGPEEYLQHQRLNRRVPVWRPPTDVFETETTLIVRVEIAGMHEADFDIVLENQQLVIRGLRTEMSERRAYHQMEIRFGEFRSEIELPRQVELDQIKAFYNNGFLTIQLPKKQPTRVKVED